MRTILILRSIDFRRGMDVNRFRPFEEDMTGRYSKGQTGRQAGRQADKTDGQIDETENDVSFQRSDS